MKNLITQTFSWSDDFLLGYRPMDDTHREFVEIVVAMQCSSPAQLPDQVRRFIVHATDHFDTENRWMFESKFPAAECHVAEHAAVMKSASEVLSLVESGNRVVGRRFADELVNWFPAHADYLDSALAQWLVKLEHGGKPIVFRRRQV